MEPPAEGGNITVIKLAPEDDPGSARAETADDHPRVGRNEEESAGPGASANPKSKIENPKSTIGLVGPMSNYAAPPQLVEDVSYRDMSEMHGFARRWRDDHRGQWFNVHKLSGFCLLMKRAVYDKIGGLDERFGIGFFDDDDLAERARRAGFELAVARDLFVHHFGSRTFVGNGVDAQKLLDENARRFAAKWGDSVPRGVRVALRPFSVNPQRGADRLGAEISGGNEAAAGLKETNQGWAVQNHGPQKTPRDADRSGDFRRERSGDGDESDESRIGHSGSWSAEDAEGRRWGRRKCEQDGGSECQDPSSAFHQQFCSGASFRKHWCSYPVSPI